MLGARGGEVDPRTVAVTPTAIPCRWSNQYTPSAKGFTYPDPSNSDLEGVKLLSPTGEGVATLATRSGCRWVLPSPPPSRWMTHHSVLTL